MFTKAVRLCTNRVKRQISDDFFRQISKTSSVPNSDVITSRQESINEDVANKKLFRLRKYHRSLSTVTSKAVPQAAMTTVASKEESREFMAIFPDIVRDLTDAGRHTDIPEITRWYSKLLQYNVPCGKKNRGLATVFSYKLLEDRAKLTPENIRLANILGWCVEMLQAFFLVSDDIMDSSEMRRGAPCWYRLDGVGLSAFNDAIMLENGIYSILRKYFRDHPAYIPVVELFHDVTLKTSMGQALDIHSICGGKPNLDLFSMDRYSAIVKYKTAYYSFQLPVALAMYLAGIYDPELHRQAKTTLLEMGHFFQVQDDFLDCYGNPEVIGKEGGNDIREGKCTWLAVVALQRATPAQRAIMEQCYGCSDDESVQAIRDVFEELGLPNTYAIYEEETYNLIHTHVQQMSGGLPHKLFFKFLEMIYRRNQ